MLKYPLKMRPMPGMWVQSMLKYPLKMRPMPGMWVQSVPVTAIPWGGMNTEQRNTLQRSVRQDD